MNRFRRLVESVIGILVLIGLLLPQPARAVAGPSATRQVNKSLRFPSTPPVSGYFLTNALGGLTFDEPVCIAAPPGETNRLFILERAGLIVVVTNLAEPTRTIFLDLQKNVYANVDGEAGLLGMAFHPGYETNRYFYIFRTVIQTNILNDQLCRFETAAADPNKAEPESELLLFAQSDGADEHNAGCVQFGPDGYLYVSLGSSAPLPQDTSPDPQPIDKGLFGGIVRLDVDKRPGSLLPSPHPGSTTNYMIPPDNPFIGATNHNGYSVAPAQVRTEFYAIGLRNPWRMSFDPLDGTLYCGDVGGADWEEIDIIRPGGNYGWPFQEGPLIWSTPPLDYSSIAPLHVYPHGDASGQGRAVVGGVVYRGSEFPELNGAYIFGDFRSGNLWALRHEGTNVQSIKWLVGDPGFTTFGSDPRDGGILTANYFKKIIQKLIYIPPSQSAAFPATLSEAGIFSDLATLTPQSGILPYEINVPFWSDNASKQRWFSVPNTNYFIGFNPTGPWSFPEGTVWIKHINMELTNGVPASTRRLETRVLVKTADGVYGVTYKWDESQTDAFLVPEEGMDEPMTIHDGNTLRDQVWHYPSQVECLRCHTHKAGFALGFNTPQLARNIQNESRTIHQIDFLSRLGYFATNVSNLSSLRPLAAITNTAYPLGYRAHSYLSANCVQCHQPSSSLQEATGTSWDARFDIPFVNSGIINGALAGNFGDPRNHPITPNSLEYSILYWRVNQRLGLQMPPLATSLIDSDAVSMLRDWILTLPTFPWQSTDIGFLRQEGFDSVTNGGFRISGAGSGIAGKADSFHFLYQNLQGNAQIAARLAPSTDGSEPAQKGVLFRGGNDANATFVMIEVDPTGKLLLISRQSAGGEVEQMASENLPNSDPWMKLVSLEHLILGYISSDGVEWQLLGSVPLNLGTNVLGGFGISSGREPALGTTDFQDAQVTTLKLSVLSSSPFVAPASVTLSAEVFGSTNWVSKVEFMANGEKLGEAVSAPYLLNWDNAVAGSYVLTARVIDGHGDNLSSSPVSLKVGLPNANAGFLGQDRVASGDWLGRYGGGGYSLVNYTNNFPASVTLVPSNTTVLAWASNTTDPRALVTTGTSRIATAWSAENEFTLNVSFLDGNLHQLTLYFLDWEGNDTRTELVELRDGKSGTLIDQQTIGSFSGGAYLKWAARGSVSFHFVRKAGSSAVLSGLFLDSFEDAPPVASLIAPPDNSIYTLPATISLEANASDPDGRIANVEFYANSNKIGQATLAPYTLSWTNAIPGSYQLTAQAVDDLGTAQTSAPISITVLAPKAEVTFVGSDEVTQGNWIGRYGFNGFTIPAYVTNYPPFALVRLVPEQVFVWQDPTEDDRALQHRNTVSRTASCWYDTELINLDVIFLDGDYHKVSLYFLDWDGGRAVNVDVVDTSDGSLLDSQSIDLLSRGIYYTWTAKGAIRFQISRLNYISVLSGIFFDPLAVSPQEPLLTLRQIGASTNPSFQFQLKGVPNYPYLIQYSTNLLDWVDWKVRLATPSGRILVFDDLEPGAPTRFYRAILSH